MEKGCFPGRPPATPFAVQSYKAAAGNISENIGNKGPATGKKSNGTGGLTFEPNGSMIQISNKSKSHKPYNNMVE